MGLGQNSKQRGLAYLGQADDSSLHKRALVHGCQLSSLRTMRIIAGVVRLRRRAILSSEVSSRVPSRRFLCLLLWVSFAPLAGAQVKFRVIDQDVIEARLRGFSKKNSERELILEQMFAQSGCSGDKLQQQVVKKKLPPNLICVVPGQTGKVILVGAHSDHADIGDGVVDNWSGASLLPSLMYSVSGMPS